MAYETGTATDSNDLFAKFRTFITSHADLVSANQAWEELEYSVDDADTAQLYLRGKGLSDSDSIYVNVYKFLEGVDSANWGFCGATGYVPGNDYSTQPGATTRSTYMLLHTTTLSYWFFANGRRFIIVAKVGGTVYQSAYGGFLIPYDLPTENPYPLMINASSAEFDQRYSWISDNSHTSMDRGGYEANDADVNAWAINPAGAWKKISSYWSQNENAFAYNLPSSSYVAGVWPYVSAGQTYGRPDYVLPAPGDEYLLRKLVVLNLHSSKSESNFFGEYDGVYNVSGANNAAENTLTIGGDTYIVFSNIYRSGLADFFVVKQE